jgi:ribose transport system permease protein
MGVGAVIGAAPTPGTQAGEAHVADSSLSSAPGEGALPVSDARPPLKGTAWIVSRVDLLLRLGLLGIILIAGFYFTLATIPSGSGIRDSIFISVGNLQDIGRQMAVVGVLALGETFVIITAGIDLSVGSLLGLSGVLCAIAFQHGWPIAVVVLTILAFSLLVGLFNGVLVGAAKIPPFIVTLGMLGVLRGVAYLVGNGNPALPSTGPGADFNTWVGGLFLGVPNIFIVLVLLAIVGGLFLRFTRRGRYIYALGSNPEAVRLSGIRVMATILTVYALSALMAGVSGLLVTGRLNGANPNNGLSYELDAIATVVLGGASLFGARGTMMGTFLGLVLINVLTNGISLTGTDPHWQQVIEGILLILVVWIDQWRKRRLESA